MSKPADDLSPVGGDRPADGERSLWPCPAETVRRPAGQDSGVVCAQTASSKELLEHLCNDQVRRWRAGQRVPAEAYLSLHPGIRDDGEATFELIYGEFLLREEMGDSPPREEFHWRFPQFAERLQRQLDLHHVLRTDEPVPKLVAGASARNGAMPEDGPLAGGRFIAPGYRILGELGRGGMGSVYKAWQVRLKRVVALKVIRPDAYADTGAAARFHAEAEAAARFQHPNIVPVFEVGEHEGMGYLVLEYAAGGGLDRHLAGTLQGPHESARLIETLARAIHYAHQHGIVHRDLKPANVLLTEDGVPKITDFGLAKLLERDEGLTRAGEILGTSSYMAPEQIRGLPDQITPATDVYSLGAILYETLTGRPPFKGTTPLSTMEQVSSQDPLAPGKLQRHLPRDLETICLKCLEKEPHRRYPTAMELAEDLGRFLQGQPILARPIPAWERAWKWARRWPSAAAALAVLVLAVALLMGGGLYHNARLRAETRTARAAEQVAAANAQAAAANAQAAIEQRNLALKALNQLVYGVQEKLGQTPATRSLRQGLLDTAIAGLDEIGRSTASSAPDLSQAVAHQKLGDIFRIIGQSVAARRHYDQSQRLAEHLLVDAPHDLAIAEELYQTYMGVGLLNIRAEQFDDAKADFRSAVAMAESIATAKPGRNEARRDLIEAYLQLGRAYSFAREFRPAGNWFRQMHDLAERWVSEEPGHCQARDLLASSYRKLADLSKFSRDFVAARRDYLKAIAIGRDILKAEADNFEFKTHLSIALDDLAGVAKNQGAFGEARQLFAEAERLFAELVKADPEHLESRLALLHTQLNMAVLEREQCRFEKAAEGFLLVRDRLLRLDREGRLEGRRGLFTNFRVLKIEIAVCEAAPRAVRDFEFARSQPPVVAARLLLIHLRSLSDQEARRQIVTTVDSLRGLTADDPEDRFDLARALSSLTTDLDSGRWPGLPPRERQTLRQGCADRAVDLLGQAVNRGLRDPGRLESAELVGLSQHPSYQALVARPHRRPLDPASRIKTSE